MTKGRLKRIKGGRRKKERRKERKVCGSGQTSLA
jgi:hypothetical protein